MIDAVRQIQFPIAEPRVTRPAALCAAVGFLSLVAAIGDASLACAADRPAGVAHPAGWPKLESAVPADPSVEALVAQLLQAMTLEEKVGQLVQADIASITPEDLSTYKLGSILAGGNAAPGGDVRVPASRWLDLTDAFFRASVANPTAEKPIVMAGGLGSPAQ